MIEDNDAARAALRLCATLDVEEAAARFGVTVEQVQAACGAAGGHTFRTYSNGDPAGPYYAEWTCCALCEYLPGPDGEV